MSPAITYTVTAFEHWILSYLYVKIMPSFNRSVLLELPIPATMDPDQLMSCGQMMLKFVADYWKTIENRSVLPSIQPGYLRPLLPSHAPEKPEQFSQIINDLESTIMRGVTHWHSPHFYAYFPTGNSYAAVCADILSAGIACIGFSWIASPSCTELEVIVMDWLAQALDLPEFFLSTGNGTASEATLVTLLAARSKIFCQMQKKDPNITLGKLLDQLIVYCSDQAHSSVDKATLIVGCKIRKIVSDDNCVMKAAQLKQAIIEDRAKNLIPFFLVATLGTTATCAFDDIAGLGKVCQDENIWLHIDAAYAGSAFICPEYRYLFDGIEYVDSFSFNPHKWMLVNFDCSAMWVKDRTYFINAFNVDPLYLKHDYQNVAPDYRHWQIPLGRRFRSLKLWFVFRIHGISGIRKYIRKHIELAKLFINYIENDKRFEIVFPSTTLGLVCFCLKNGSNELNEKLLKSLNEDKRIYLVPSMVKGRFILRFAICSYLTEVKHVDYAWTVINEITTKLLTKT
ncbi:unnamed protein product [Didymodactylos carnosus]|uniref:Aromatic-L-amino-acid decarboxylase n=1 Tax=Didymodactylos carnosus TaxID=1234261 RepID=A0A814A5K7_9BILA|nr:unnamed protein product [Didymodactylos carnosus]CAF0909187.1 unnamed protein product [Didymodactylos carnosus]CAF3528465.1 unnamed protein product [Didymodactylos carnosus]CAF3690573.1 unnamed protein product [Didymodactylos carnosus]